MIAQTPWFKRKFPVITDYGQMPNIIERLKGTIYSLDHKFLHYDPEILRISPPDKWSVMEEAGHLLDLEPLWLGRIYDIKNEVEFMREADLTNRKTHEAGHNSKSTDTIFQTFKNERSKLLELLSGLKLMDLEKKSFHPRLKTPMHIIDLAHFVAEHDDHHLTRMSILAMEMK